MDQNTMQLLAEKLGVAKEFEAIQAGDISSLAGRFSNPFMAALMNSMLNSNSIQLENSETDTNYKRELARAIKTIRHLREKLTSADKMARYIAEIFGACQLCWGLNKLCSACQGKGQPGFIQPMEEELLAWVKPALQKLNLKIQKAEQ